MKPARKPLATSPYVIERGIPVAKRQAPRRPKSPMREALEQLKSGESFCVPVEQIARLNAMACSARKATGRKFCVRRVDEFARVWRLE